MTAVLTSFLPQSHADTYLPAIFKIWEGFNSAFVDERFMELAGNLSRDHISGPEGQYGKDGTVHWKDVGIWSNDQWNLLTSKGLNMMSTASDFRKTVILTETFVIQVFLLARQRYHYRSWGLHAALKHYNF
jgi:proteasome activator subunit 4